MKERGALGLMDRVLEVEMSSTRLSIVVVVAGLVVTPSLTGYAQLAIEDLTTLSPEDLVSILVSPDSAAVISNIVFTGPLERAGSFAFGNSVNLGINHGVVMGSGFALSAVGPNTTDDTTGDFSTPGGPFLDSLVPGYSTYDACVLEFDFACADIPFVSFAFVFGSEEYNEYVDSPYNDVFGFALNGTNIAIIPESPGLPVAINNLNCGNPYDPTSPTTPNLPFCDLFRCNDLDDCGALLDLEADGLSVVLPATGAITAGSNHIKLAVGDAGDYALDTWLFLEAGSFQCGFFVGIDIRPGSYPNCSRIDGHGMVTAAVLGGAGFDVEGVDPMSLTLDNAPVKVKGTGLPFCSVEDVSGDFSAGPEGAPDGYPDLVCRFLDDGSITFDDGEAVLEGTLFDGTVFAGADEICALP
jgi:hypothetical protein